MSFIVEKYVEGGWVFSDGPITDKWRARELARTSGNPISPSRVIDLSIGEGKVLCLYGRTEPPFPIGWREYSVTDRRRGDENTMDTKITQPNALEPKVEVPPTPTATASAVVVETPAPTPVSAPVISPPPSPPTPTQEVSAAVENLMSGTDDEMEAEVPIPTISHTDAKTVALLFSGGTFSTATLLHLIARGFEITPFYMEDPEFEGTDRELKIAKSVIRIARSATRQVKDLTVISVKIPKKQEARRHRYYVEVLTRELQGNGFNAIAYGAQPLEVTEDISEEQAEDTDTSSLQECTPLEIICPDLLDIGGMEQQIAPFTSSTVAKEMLLASTSCDDPGETRRECGDCRKCKNRFRIFFRLFGDLNPKRYMKGSWVRKKMDELQALIATKGEAGLTADEVKAILFPKKKDKKAE